jgi:integrase
MKVFYMRPRGNEFGIFRKKIRGSTIFYFWVYDTTGKRRFRSTGKRKFDDAVKFCRTLQIKGQLYSGTAVSFSLYTQDFFDYEHCPYISYRLLRGYSYGRPWARRQKSLLDKVIRPYFNKQDIRLINAKQIDDFIFSLKKENYSNKTINHVITTLKNIFHYATINNTIEVNPCTGIKPFKSTSREKGILTREELKSLFSSECQTKIWPDMMHYILNYVAATTGMRLGEILALQPQDISDTKITVSHSYNSLDGLKGTKTAKTREIPIPEKLKFLLTDYCYGKRKDEFIFSANHGSNPVDHKTIYRWYWRALNAVGIDKSERLRRRISFHSYRHGYNTILLEEGIAPETVRLLTGHSAAMTSHYSHIKQQNVPKVLNFI